MVTVAVKDFLMNFPEAKEVEKNKKPVKIASDAPNVLEEYFIAHPLIELDGVPRVVVHTDTNFLKETDDRNG